jgi:hypothetical protein
MDPFLTPQYVSQGVKPFPFSFLWKSTLCLYCSNLLDRFCCPILALREDFCPLLTFFVLLVKVQADLQVSHLSYLTPQPVRNYSKCSLACESSLNWFHCLRPLEV